MVLLWKPVESLQVASLLLAGRHTESLLDAIREKAYRLVASIEAAFREQACQQRACWWLS
jgi:hypothetical protein